MCFWKPPYISTLDRFLKLLTNVVLCGWGDLKVTYIFMRTEDCKNESKPWFSLCWMSSISLNSYVFFCSLTTAYSLILQRLKFFCLGHFNFECFFSLFGSKRLRIDYWHATSQQWRPLRISVRSKYASVWHKYFIWFSEGLITWWNYFNGF